MAFLLGTQSCIESLRSDLRDIQDTIDEILIRTGPIKCYSWKSPDKLVTDLKIKELIDRYKFSKDEVDNQISHYSLLELIIDRLLLLIHLSTLYSETSLNSTDISSLNSGTKTASLTAGLNVKKFWNKYTQLCIAFRQISNQNKTSTAMAKKKTSFEDVRISKVTTTTTNDNSNNSRGNKQQVSNEVSTKSVQTAETAFVPCESCAKVQNNLKQNADMLINMCHYQNINSQVGKFRANLMCNQLVGGWLNGADLEKWLIEQDKDLVRINKQFEFLSKNNELLQSKMKENEASMQKMSQNEKELKKTLKEEQDSRLVTTKQYEKKLADQKSELNGKISGLEAELANLKKIKTSLEEKYEALKNLNDNNEKIIVELNETNKSLSNELTARVEQNEKMQAGEEEKKLINKELECLKRELGEKAQELSNERLKVENLIRNEQSLKLKHESTLELLDKQTADYEEIKRKIGYIEEEKKQLLANIKHRESDIENMKYEGEILQSSVDTLKLELKKQKENEILLLKYPDLYGPMSHIEDEEAESNVASDMQNQINANKHRIYLLNNLNKKLENSLKKLNETTTNVRSGSSSSNSAKKENRRPDTGENGGGGESNRNYFVKQQAMSASSVGSTPKSADEVNGNRPLLTRPVPFFKLDSEVEDHQKSASQKGIRSQSSSKFTPPKKQQSTDDEYDDEVRLVNDYEEDDNNNTNDLDLDNDEHFDFLKEKHDADKSLVNQLNQITNQSELRIESAASVQSRRQGLSSRDHSATFYYSPHPPLANATTTTTTNNSRPVSMMRRPNSSTSSRGIGTMVNIPPAEKNMEVVVGKGRRSAATPSSSSRANSANQTNSTTTASNQRKNSLNSMPPLPSSTTSTNNRTYSCDSCHKKYSNGKDLDIHKMYCNV